MFLMTKQKRTLIRLVIILFGFSRAILSQQGQSEPTKVRNGHQETARANESRAALAVRVPWTGVTPVMSRAASKPLNQCGR